LHTSEFVKRFTAARLVAFKCKRFGFEPEITAKISRIFNIRIYKVGISYYGRIFEEGKKMVGKIVFELFIALYT